ncbi:phosphopantothenoylcysteine decarboxylase isoform X1 [Gopherus evgoodei]|uniref:Phosphopantothenoylcysteine decarboxylase n=1 Tax=Gopherus agassizii TaxID=38772 RepID=A0A452GST3_9SAUR|nr:phosphopantothenoylcysteine decarboxylase isoform X1 [Gopherus evgoodei]XP_030432625.1 phosphopantothenoylcysteine decarboxylase isoform X1 [Gopherus evgoodei]XP_030432626.1 phosphopantothenoylcysteine decarboxylase isoform X1 [Gopherus evgoodei]XP_030432627.1 phosphopantothenoylcysteine decarboxylase isoform X1 [Gopherus evgoodei]XP_030432628.1 phosphopantothenoylcysteine decarboxylase isoform X1 [Gopherus evgoodei]XP_030432629.1 phosphopantothenoylcysteine decarboxylase isoform X1 [Gopher
MEPLTLSEPQPSPQNSLPTPEKTYHVLVGVTGSVAALKLPVLVSELLEIPGLKVRVVTTERAKHFYNPQEIPVTLYSDAEEWQLWKGRTDPVLHIDLRRWADLMLVAPLDANTLAKIANGICDNLLTCVIRAWDMTKPLLFCPAMNTAMWEHPITAHQVEQLKDFGYTEIPCVVKRLVCGDEGVEMQTSNINQKEPLAVPGSMLQVLESTRLATLESLGQLFPRDFNAPFEIEN